MQTLKINFGKFWPDFHYDDNYFTRILSKKYKIEISKNPDFYFFTHSYAGHKDYLKYKCHRIFLGWENARADWNICDYVLDSDFYVDNPRHKRWPIWASWHPDRLTMPKKLEAFSNKKKFCCMIVSNGNAKDRIAFFNQLSKYKKVDSGGFYMNNVGGPVADKMSFISDYKFVFSFENSVSPGYTTEKLIHPIIANSIPLYWGNPKVDKDFNTKSFINIPNVNSFDEAMERIILLDNDEEKYMAMAAEPWFNNNKVPGEMTQESLAEFFDFIIEDSKSKKPVGSVPKKVFIHQAELLKNRVVGSVKQRLGIERGFR